MQNTYEDILYLAGRMVGAAELHVKHQMDQAELYLLAGFLRGLVFAGEPVDSALMRKNINLAERRLNVYTRLDPAL